MNVLKMNNIGGQNLSWQKDSVRGKTTKEQHYREQNLKGYEALNEEEKKIYNLQKVASETSHLMKDNTQNLYKDRELIEKLVKDQNKIDKDMGQTTYKIFEVEKVVYQKKLILIALIVMFGFIDLYMFLSKFGIL